MSWRPYIRGRPFLCLVRPTATSRTPTGLPKLYGTRLDELQVAASLLPLIRGDFSREWSSCVTATDASTGGWGICETTLDPK
eukprot:14228689-Heterocapsa_arctica.AAC.1